MHSGFSIQADEADARGKDMRDKHSQAPEGRSYWNQGTDYVSNSTALMFLVTEAVAIVWLMILALTAK